MSYHHIPFKGRMPRKAAITVYTKACDGSVKELRRKQIKSNLKNIDDFGKPIGAERLLLASVQTRRY